MKFCLIGVILIAIAAVAYTLINKRERLSLTSSEIAQSIAILVLGTLAIVCFWSMSLADVYAMSLPGKSVVTIAFVGVALCLIFQTIEPTKKPRSTRKWIAVLIVAIYMGLCIFELWLGHDLIPYPFGASPSN